MLRSWLELARISNLPTVWTNVLAGWVLADGAWRWPTAGVRALAGFWAAPLFWLLVGASLIYTAGMILNDAFDAKYDREHRRERPIPSGRVTAGQAWFVGLAMLGGGAVLCVLAGGACAWLVGALVAAILIYDAYHKPWPGSVFVMGSCRTLLCLVAGSAVDGGLDMREHFALVVSAIALGGYVTGLSLVARSESLGANSGIIGRWVGRIGLALPLVAGLFLWGAGSAAVLKQRAVASARSVPNLGGFSIHDGGGLLFVLVQPILLVLLAALIIWSVKLMRRPPRSNIGRAVGLLLAGIVLVDAVAICPDAPLTALLFAGLVPALLLWQRKIAAT